jgi:RNA polymerase sigma factor (sigma-70 family)
MCVSPGDTTRETGERLRACSWPQIDYVGRVNSEDRRGDATVSAPAQPRVSAVAAEFDRQRSLLWKLCYRMTGSAADADDAVQDTFERLLSHPPADLETELRPWLVRVALNSSRDQLRARRRRSYVGPWLPAPIETGDLEEHDLTPLPDARYSELESVSTAFLVALEALTPTERALVLLRDVLGYSVRESASALAITESNAKTTHHRARKALQGYDHTRLPMTRALGDQTQAALRQLVLALLAGDVPALEALLSDDVRTLNDSDGEFYAARVPITGKARVIKFHLKLRRAEVPQVAVRSINGLPALVCEYAQTLPGAASRCVIAIALDGEGRIRELNSIVASRKLTHVRFEP